jgi:hypothetical protein
MKNSPGWLVQGQTMRCWNFLLLILRVHLCRMGMFSIAGNRCFAGWRSN